MEPQSHLFYLCEYSSDIWEFTQISEEQDNTLSMMMDNAQIHTKRSKYWGWIYMDNICSCNMGNLDGTIREKIGLLWLENNREHNDRDQLRKVQDQGKRSLLQSGEGVG